MENKLLEAINDVTANNFATLGDAQREFSALEIFDAYLEYEGICGYTGSILRALNTLGILNCEEMEAYL